ncbi:bifunctional sulfate adenylyltransferase/adenylylsulfate kinase [sulfur-oxidizing endosymbiont of Gigantopelta aegis]|uniref:bifunctional sulfate adenylyltransferase/adenylylsulfate kinase n=1 Tax=sulfur-oxidizing endosymbiont of Gigantopelta aegis TaxID=2794934 RepID=UPI0018DE573B|nr:bifunctional sulfate adenylyltransferase/adenylylsulfate kinase [sulfur-oxidizing endosymbiont of Gigantopelta aegis]
MPHGGDLVNLLVAPEEADSLKQQSEFFPSITLTKRQLCDLEMLINGAMSPLTGYMDKETYDSVIQTSRLPNNLLWPMPIVLDIEDKLAEKLSPGDKVALRDTEGFMPAVLTVSDIWQADKKLEADTIYGTQSNLHPGVDYLLNQSHSYYIGGEIQGTETLSHFDFEQLWSSPAELRALFNKQGWRNVLAFQTSQPMHKVHQHITLNAARENNAHILIHPTVGITKPGDLDYYARVHCYQAIQKYYPTNLATMSLLPLAMRMAGPKEALWHAIVNKNYGCSHILIGPEHASPPTEQFYAHSAAQQYVTEHADELGIIPVCPEETRYVAEKQAFLPLSSIKKDKLGSEMLSVDELKNHLQNNHPIPEWFSYPEVLKALSRAYPPLCKQGITLFFTGLSGSGKSTLAKIIYAKLIELGTRPVTLLDGDIVRHNLSSELGFSRNDRNINVRRISFVANEITKNGGVAICAPIAPYTEMRRSARELIEQYGAFIEIHVATPLEVCESRDRKGLYAKARKGIIPEFTGISDPYEQPETPEMRIDTSQFSPMEAAQAIYLYLFREGYIETAENCGQ